MTGSATNPIYALLPNTPLEKRAPSSSEKITTSYDFSGVYDEAFHASATSNAASTPSTPSKFPPEGTVSRCEPEAIDEVSSLPFNRPKTLPRSEERRVGTEGKRMLTRGEW